MEEEEGYEVHSFDGPYELLYFCSVECLADFASERKRDQFNATVNSALQCIMSEKKECQTGDDNQTPITPES